MSCDDEADSRSVNDTRTDTGHCYTTSHTHQHHVIDDDDGDGDAGDDAGGASGRLSPPTDCIADDNLSSLITHDTASSHHLCVAESNCVSSMATHRMPATLPLTTSKQHQSADTDALHLT